MYLDSLNTTKEWKKIMSNIGMETEWDAFIQSILHAGKCETSTCVPDDAWRQHFPAWIHKKICESSSRRLFLTKT